MDWSLQMDLFSWLALISYTLAFLIIVAFSAAYLTRSDFMPYHSVAVSRAWSEVEPRMQVLLLALMKVTGWAWLATAMAGFLLLHLLFTQKGGIGQLIVFQLFCLIAVTPPIVVAFYVRKKTLAATPLLSGFIVLLLTVLGFLFALLSDQYA
jgi:hypothetical protein